MGARLRVERLSVSFGAVPLFRAQSFELEPGAVLALIGPSGSGKSTLLRAIAQLVPSSGEVRLDEESPEQIGWPRFRRRVIYVHQQPAFVPGSVAENLARAFSYRSSSSSFNAAEASLQLERLGLEVGLLARLAHTLSVGEGQRIALLRALLLRPDVLLLDEPTSALDPEHRDKTEALILEHVHGQRCSALVVTHDPEQAQRFGGSVHKLGTPGVADG